MTLARYLATMISVKTSPPGLNEETRKAIVAAWEKQFRETLVDFEAHYGKIHIQDKKA